MEKDNPPVKVGDMLWVTLKGPASDYGYGEVTEVWFDEGANDYCYFFHCLVNGGQRIGYSKKIIEKPTGRMKNKYLIARKEYNEALKESFRR